MELFNISVQSFDHTTDSKGMITDGVDQMSILTHHFETESEEKSKIKHLHSRQNFIIHKYLKMFLQFKIQINMICYALSA